MSSIEFSEEYLKQGLYFLLREETVVNLAVGFSEEIVPELMEQAVNHVLDKNPYYRLTFYEKEERFCTEYNQGYFTVEREYKKRSIPKAAKDFLFEVSCVNTVMYFDYNHFLSDGRGIVPFIVAIITEYLNLAYGIGVPMKQLPIEKEYDYETFFRNYYTPSGPLNKKNWLPLEEEGKNYTFKIPYLEVKKMAKSHGVGVFALVMAIFSEVFDKDIVNVSYSIDVRKQLKVENAPYNCVAPVVCSVDRHEDFASRVVGIQKEINEKRENGDALRQLAGQLKGILDLYQMDLPMKKKKRICKISETMVMETDCWISFAGDFLYTADESIKPYITFWKMRAPEGKNYLGIEVIQFKDELQICLCLRNETLLPRIKEVFKTRGWSVQMEETDLWKEKN